MPRYVAFLRAINVGSHIVKMDQLRRLFEALGFSNVETFINSGNVIFDAASKNTAGLEKKIAASLEETLRYEVATFIRSTAELTKISNDHPFLEEQLAEGHALYIAFLADSPGAEAKKKLLSFTTKIDEFHFSRREVYWLCRFKKMSESAFSGALLEKTLGMRATFRNSNTVKRIASKYS
jgi:uncharacterized protein (DUF1697 family)